MRLRVTVQDAATGAETDVEVRCAPGDTVGAVRASVEAALPLAGPLAVDGAELADDVPLRDSALVPGALVTCGRPGRRAPAAPRIGHLALRVVSGPSAGAVLPLGPGVPVVIGRDAGVDLPLLDTDVSRRHAEVTPHGDAVEVRDLDSTNGTWVDGGRHLRATVLPGGSFQVGGSRVELVRAASTRAALAPHPAGGWVVNPRFRVRTAAPATRIDLPAAPADAPGRALPLVGVLAPLAIAVVMALATGHLQYLLFALLSPLTMVANHVADRRGDRARRRQERERYDEQVARAAVRAVGAADEEDAWLRSSWPDPASVLRIATVPEVELWERRPADDDWLQVRLGSSDLPSSVHVEGPQPSSWPELLLRDAPVGVSLRATPVLGLAGAPLVTTGVLRSVVVQLAALHSPDDVRLVVLAPGARAEDLGWARWLPHCSTSEGTPLTAWDDLRTDALVDWLTGQLEQRRPREGRPPSAGEVLPRLVVVLAGPGAGTLLRSRPAVVTLLRGGTEAGMSFVCVEQDDRLLPAECTAALVCADGGRAQLRVTEGPAHALTPETLDAQAADNAARSLAPLRPVPSAEGGRGLPPLVRLVDLTGEPDVEQLRAAWRLAPERTAVPIGLDADGPFLLDLARQGPHGLLAGMTGMGKSELVQTLIAGLALANDPHHLNFVFVDWGGGPTFRVLKQLPHVAGNVSNLDQRTVGRALSSLQAELRRRQTFLAGHGVDNRDAYLRLAATDPSLPPLPRLVVVVDEFAELKDNAPDVLSGFVSVSRVGRKLGMHLLLCTQEMGRSVDPQVKTNSDLRICLRVPEPTISMDVLDSPVAADLPQTPKGRAYVRAGDTAPRLLQTAISTLPARAAGAGGPVAALLRWSDAPTADRPGVAGTESDLERLVAVLGKAAGAEGLSAPAQLWTPPLPELIPLSDLPTAPGGVVVGLRDRPAEQRQEPLLLPLASEHLAVVGSAGTGRTTALRSFAVSAVEGTSPERLHVHVLDGTGALAGLAALPHVGVVARPDEEERVDRLVGRLEALTRARRRALADAGMASVAEQRALDPDSAPADVLLLVDGWDRFFEPALPRTTQLLSVLDNGIAAGVTVVVAGDESVLRARLLARVPAVLYLRLNNSHDWPGKLQLGNLPQGRALWGRDGSEVQIPVLGGSTEGAAQTQALRDFAALEQRRWASGEPGAGPMRLDPLPDETTVSAAWRLAPPPGDDAHLLVGVGGDRLTPLWARPEGGPVVIAGPPRSGRSTAVAAFGDALQRQGVPVLVVAGRAAADHPAHKVGVPVVRVADAAAALAAEAPPVVLVDDADRSEIPADLLAALTGPGAPVLVVAALLDSFALGGRDLLRAALRGPRVVLALCPPDRASARNVGIQLAAGQGHAGPAGRAYVLMDGATEMVQVPLPG